MRTPFMKSIGRTRFAVIVAVAAVVAALLLPVGTATADPAPTPTPRPPHHALAMGKFAASAYAAQAAHLPAGLTTALKRDLGVTPAEYLADAAAAAQAVQVVASLKVAGVHVLGSRIKGTTLTVNVASSADRATVDATGATSVVGAPVVPDLGNRDFKSVVANTPTYGGEAIFYQAVDQLGGPNGFRCSVGFNGYSSAAVPQFVTAGHCATSFAPGYDARLVTQTAPTNYGGTATVTTTVLGTAVSGEAQYGGGMDYGIVGAGSSVVPQASLYTWGGGASAPLSSTPLPVTGQTAAVVGANLCKSGSTTGWTCGSVLAVDQIVPVSGQDVNSIVATTCLLQGDSGGGAVIGSNAAGVDSGSDFSGTSCANSFSNGEWAHESVFFPIVSAGGNDSVTGQVGANWKLLAAPVVTSPVAGATLTTASLTMTGTLFNPMTGAQIGLFLDGSSTAAAQVDGSTGSFLIPLSGLSQGAHTYTLGEFVAGNQVASVAGSFTVVTSVPTVTAPASAAAVYPSTVMTGTITSPVAASTALLYLDGSTTAYAKVNASSGSWNIPLTGIAAGSHTYKLAAGINTTAGTAVTGTFVETAIPATASHIDGITGGVGVVNISGWALWHDQPSAAVFMAIQVGNSWTAMTANTSNTESLTPYPNDGSHHGFSAALPLAPGSYSVCIWAGGSAGGSVNIGCKTVTVTTPPPPPPTQAHIDSITGGVGSLSVAGWAVWPDKLSSSVTLAVQIGNSWTALTANRSNTDSGQPSGAGTNHGFSGTIALAPGAYSVCIWTNGSAGGAVNQGCQTVTVLAAPPTQAHIDGYTGYQGYFRVTGWAFWPDKPTSSVNLALQLDGGTWIAGNANQSTTDNDVPDGAGPNHGFTFDINAMPGSHSVCIWAGGSVGPATTIGCATVVVLVAHAT